MSLRQVGGVALGCGLFSVLLGYGGAPQSGDGMAQMRQLARGIHLYSLDHSDTYPIAMPYDGVAQQWAPNYRTEAPAGFLRDGHEMLKASYPSVWINSVAPYWPSIEILAIPGAPDAPVKYKLEDTLRDPWRVGFNYNGYMHTLSRSTVVHPELVPLIWTGHGRANSRGHVSAMPNLRCWPPSTGPCIFTNSPDPANSIRTMMSPPLASAAVFDGAMVFGMADGSAIREHPHLKEKPFLSATDPWVSYDRDGKALSHWMLPDGYILQFRPDRKPKE